MNENGIEIGRYQIVAVGRGESVLLDTATGSSWSLARDIDTLQLGWRPLEERWPDTALGHAPDRPPALSGEEARGAAAWWKPRLGPRWPRMGRSEA